MDSVGNAINSAEGVKNTFSSWDNCMSKAYCKWPVIVAIIAGSLIVLSLLWCCARCLCCGAECCCGCLACCNACCPSPRGGRRDKGYQPAPPSAQQYQPPPPPIYAGQNTGYVGQNTKYGGGAALAAAAPRNVPKTAVFEDSRSKTAYVNEDALPAMPSWDDATKRRIEEPHEETDMEMEKLSPSHAQQEVGLLTGSENNGQNRHDYNAREEAGDLGAGGMNTHAHANPYQDYGAPSQQRLPYPANQYASAQNVPLPASPSYHSPQDTRQPAGSWSAQDVRQPAYPYSSNTMLQNPYQSASPVTAPYGSSSNFYAGANAPARHYSPPQQQYQQHQQQQQSYSRGYEPSIAAPSYHTHDVVSPVSPPPAGQQPQHYQAYGSSPPRKPVAQQYSQQPNWREI